MKEQNANSKNQQASDIQDQGPAGRPSNRRRNMAHSYQKKNWFNYQHQRSQHPQFYEEQRGYLHQESHFEGHHHQYHNPRLERPSQKHMPKEHQYQHSYYEGYYKQDEEIEGYFQSHERREYHYGYPYGDIPVRTVGTGYSSLLARQNRQQHYYEQNFEIKSNDQDRNRQQIDSRTSRNNFYYRNLSNDKESEKEAKKRQLRKERKKKLRGSLRLARKNIPGFAVQFPKGDYFSNPEEYRQACRLGKFNWLDCTRDKRGRLLHVFGARITENVKKSHIENQSNLVFNRKTRGIDQPSKGGYR